MIVGLLQKNSLITKLKAGESTDVDSGGIEVVEPAMGWVYVGSHNFTQAAWGTLSGSAFNPVLNASIASSCDRVFFVFMQYFLTDHKLRARNRSVTQGHERGRSRCMFPAVAQEVHTK